MRCLRCAIEYGPDEQFCQRCGRALSRPLGEKTAVVEGTAALQSEARFFYTTTAPPPLQTGNQDDAETVRWETPVVPAGAPSVWGVSAESAGTPNNAVDPAPGWDSWAGGQAEDRPPSPAARRAVPSLPPAQWVDSSATFGSDPALDSTLRPGTQGGDTTESAIPATASSRLDTLLDDFFGDDDDDEESALVSGVKGSAASTGRGAAAKGTFARPTYGTKAAGDRWSKSRSLVLVVLVAVVIIALGGYAFTRQRAYNSDLSHARTLALAGQYQSALTDYNKAIADWPFNGDARNGANAVRDAAAAVQQQAQAAALLQAHNNATRQGMYQAHMGLILQEVAGKS